MVVSTCNGFSATVTFVVSTLAGLVSFMAFELEFAFALIFSFAFTGSLFVLTGVFALAGSLALTNTPV